MTGEHRIIRKVIVESLYMNSDFLESIYLTRFHFCDFRKIKISHLHGIAITKEDSHKDKLLTSLGVYKIQEFFI